MSRSRDGLADYRAKRDVRRSGEPGARRSRKATREPVFVVQHHLASSDHFDFRLEVDGVLKSWAIPKGPSTDPQDKRMARPTEDHPLDYASFEGVIPEGQYGAGPVQVWDTGGYHNRTEDHGRPVEIAKALRRGHVSFELDGQKLHGGFALTRMRRGGDETWLLVKKADEHAGKPIRATTKSALSGRTLNQIRKNAT